VISFCSLCPLRSGFLLFLLKERCADFFEFARSCEANPGPLENKHGANARGSRIVCRIVQSLEPRFGFGLTLLVDFQERFDQFRPLGLSLQEPRLDFLDCGNWHEIEPGAEKRWK